MILAIDIGGTKTLIAVFNEDGDIKEKLRFETPKIYEELQSELARNISELNEKNFDYFAVAAPGRIDYKNGIVLAFGNLEWTNTPLLSDIEKITNTPGVIENDTKLAALAEAQGHKDSHKVLYITISTGIGGGLITDGKIDSDFKDNEIGHMLMEHRGKLVRWQEFASGKAIVNQFGKHASEIEDPQAWYIISRNIAIGLNAIIATLTPDLIIIGGGVGAHFEKFEGRLSEELKIYESPMFKIPPIVKAKHPEEAVIYGCYYLAKEFAQNHK